MQGLAKMAEEMHQQSLQEKDLVPFLDKQLQADWLQEAHETAKKAVDAKTKAAKKDARVKKKAEAAAKKAAEEAEQKRKKKRDDAAERQREFRKRKKELMGDTLYKFDRALEQQVTRDNRARRKAEKEKEEIEAELRGLFL